MKIINLLNAIIIEVKKNNKNYYFFLDSGCPYSFSSDISSINNNDLGIDVNFDFKLHKSLIDLNDLSEIFGVKLSGILGIDFFYTFWNIKIDIKAKEIEFNTDDFKYDFDIDLLNKNPFIIDISLENNNCGKCLVDTGAFQCMNFSKTFSNNYKSSTGWVFPSALGQMNINYYSNIGIYFNNFYTGKYIFGVPTNLPPVPFSYVLGMNFMADHICYFDLENNKLKFKISNKKDILNSKPIYSLKFQIKLINKEIIVTNKLQGCNLDINIGDKIIIPDLDMDNLEVVNDIYNKLIFINSDDEIDLICNGKKANYKPVELFN
jgi:hypothetical protein